MKNGDVSIAKCEFKLTNSTGFQLEGFFTVPVPSCSSVGDAHVVHKKSQLTSGHKV